MRNSGLLLVLCMAFSAPTNARTLICMWDMVNVTNAPRCWQIGPWGNNSHCCGDYIWQDRGDYMYTCADDCVGPIPAPVDDYEQTPNEQTGQRGISWGDTTYMSAPVIRNDSAFVVDKNGDEWLFGILKSAAPEMIDPAEEDIAAELTSFDSEKSKFDVHFSIFPNPAFSDRVNIDLHINGIPQNEPFIDIYIYDFRGNVVRQIEVHAEEPSNFVLPVSMDNLENGVYYVSVRHSQGISTQKLIFSRL